MEWQSAYVEAKALCVRVVAACGREDLARSLADKHGYLEGTVALCHEAELQKVNDMGKDVCILSLCACLQCLILDYCFLWCVVFHASL